MSLFLPARLKVGDLQVTEAMCVGLPIICGNHTSLKEITRNGKDVNAVYHQFEHVQIHDGNAIRYCLDSEQVSHQMLLLFNKYIASGGFEIENYDYQRNKYDWDKIAVSWTKIISSLL